MARLNFLYSCWCLNIIKALCLSEGQSEQLQFLQDSFILFHIFSSQLEHIIFSVRFAHSPKMSDAESVSFPGAPSPFFHRAVR